MDLHAGEPLVLTSSPLESGATLIVHRSIRSLYQLMFLFLASTAAIYLISYGLSSGGRHGALLERHIGILRWFGLVPIGLLLEMARSYYNDLYQLSPEAITHFSGRLSTRYAIPSIRYLDIRAIQVRQGVIGRLMNFGTIEISTAAQERTEMQLIDIYNPRVVALLIDRMRGIRSGRRELPLQGDSGQPHYSAPTDSDSLLHAD